MTGEALDAEIEIARTGGFSLRADLRVDAGEAIAVMGPSGAGKSTLLAAIAGLERLSDGRVRIGTRDVARAQPFLHERLERRGVVLLGQEPRLFPHLTARENVAFGPRAQRTAAARARADADDWLARVGLPGLGDRRPAELSGGQQQRVAIARALAASPRLLLLDEPFTSLDAETASDLRAMVQQQLVSVAATAVIVTHDVLDAVALARRLFVVEGGRVTQQGEVRDVLAAPATGFAATLAGVNRVVGVAHGGAWASPRGEVRLETSDQASRAAAAAEGSELTAVFRPAAVRLDAPSSGVVTGSGVRSVGAGTWLGRVVRLEQTPAGVRVHTADPPVAADVSVEAVAALGLAPDVPVQLSVAPDAVRLHAAG